MAIIAFTQQALIGNGLLTPAYTGSLSTANTYTFPNDGKTFLHCKKTGAGVCTVTAVTPGTVGGNAIADPTYTVPATTGDVMIGPFSPSVFNDPATGLVTVSFSEVTGLSAAVVQMPAV